jgi:hypothetical protein
MVLGNHDVATVNDVACGRPSGSAVGAVSDAFVRRMAIMYGSDLPPAVAAVSRQRILDALGDVLGSVRHGTVTKLRAAARRLDREGAIPLPGGGDRFGPGWATRIFGVAEGLGALQRSQSSGAVHRETTALAVVWSLVAMEPQSAEPTAGRDRGDRELAAFACGIEGQLRIRRAVVLGRDEEGWDLAGLIGVIGAAMTATALLGGRESEFSKALGIAASMTVGVGEMSGSDVEPFHAGQACANGLQAALLARQDFWASSRVLEADRGYFSVLFGRDWDPSIMSSGPIEGEWLFQETAEPADGRVPEEDFVRRAEPVVGCRRAREALQCISSLGNSTEIRDLMEICDVTS